MSGTITVDGDNLVFEFHGVDRIFTFRHSITVPISHVVDVSTDRVPWISGMRAFGTGIPGVVKDGEYIDKDGSAFYEVHDPDKCVTITLKDDKHKRFVVQVEDKESAALIIRNAISGQQITQ
ncbi:MAG: hypothetical protein OK456_02295 [Thaumarchaeota archaeon]|nr:hypothetical protein [Nitrososphaerota archaeon]